ncbi:hypothetical protein ES708_24319 [subsurface metagenome]
MTPHSNVSLSILYSYYLLSVYDEEYYGVSLSLSTQPVEYKETT